MDQILAILAVFYGAQLMLRAGDGSVETFAAEPPTWRAGADLPPGRRGSGRSFAALARSRPGRLTRIGWRLGAPGTRLGAVPIAGRAGRCVDGARRVSDAVAGGAEAAVFRLTRKLVARDSQLAARSWPALGVALAALVLGAATDQLADPFRVGDARIALTLAYPVLVAAAVPLLYQYLVFSKDHEASWVLRGLPWRALARGVRRAVLLSYVLPVALLGAAVMAWQWRSPLHAAAQLGVLWLLVEAAVAGLSAGAAGPTLLAATPAGREHRACLLTAALVTGAGGVVALQYAGVGPLATVALFLGLLVAVAAGPLGGGT